jgi:hypothetical protein
VADQVFQQIEYLWRDRDDVRSAIQLAQVGVECVVLEEIAQGVIPWMRGDFTARPSAG